MTRGMKVRTPGRRKIRLRTIQIRKGDESVCFEFGINVVEDNILVREERKGVERDIFEEKNE